MKSIIKHKTAEETFELDDLDISQMSFQFAGEA